MMDESHPTTSPPPRELHHRYAFVPFYREGEAARHLARLGRASPERSRSALDFVRRVYGPVSS